MRLIRYLRKIRILALFAIFSGAFVGIDPIERIRIDREAGTASTQGQRRQELDNHDRTRRGEDAYELSEARSRAGSGCDRRIGEPAPDGVGNKAGFSRCTRSNGTVSHAIMKTRSTRLTSISTSDIIRLAGTGSRTAGDARVPMHPTARNPSRKLLWARVRRVSWSRRPNDPAPDGERRRRGRVAICRPSQAESVRLSTCPAPRRRAAWHAGSGSPAEPADPFTAPDVGGGAAPRNDTPKPRGAANPPGGNAPDLDARPDQPGRNPGPRLRGTTTAARPCPRRLTDRSWQCRTSTFRLWRTPVPSTSRPRTSRQVRAMRRSGEHPIRRCAGG